MGAGVGRVSAVPKATQSGTFDSTGDLRVGVSGILDGVGVLVELNKRAA
jgi:hypothetical protein